jgi:hypothetical protein
VKPFKKSILMPDSDLYAADVIAEIREIQKHHPGLINPLTGSNPADPFLIAVAKSHLAIVVTDEKSKGLDINLKSRSCAQIGTSAGFLAMDI